MSSVLPAKRFPDRVLQPYGNGFFCLLPAYSPDSKTVYQALHEKYGDTMSVKQLAEYFKVGKRTIFEWERKGYITNISTKSYETTSAGHKKRGEEKRYLTSDIAKSVEMQRKFSRL